jgi:hypothetical protein
MFPSAAALNSERNLPTCSRPQIESEDDHNRGLPLSLRTNIRHPIHEKSETNYAYLRPRATTVAGRRDGRTVIPEQPDRFMLIEMSFSGRMLAVLSR